MEDASTLLTCVPGMVVVLRTTGYRQELAEEDTDPASRTSIGIEIYDVFLLVDRAYTVIDTGPDSRALGNGTGEEIV